MRLPEICIRQPVLSIVLSLVLVLLGIVGFKSLEIRFFPEVEVPVVTIHSYYEGASANLMESQVTRPIENAVSGVDGVKSVSSSSSAQRSTITVLFRLGGNFEKEASQVRDKVFGLRDKLPSDMNLPTVNVGSTGDRVLGIGIIDKNKTNAEIRNYLQTVIVPQLNEVKGVGGIDVLGGSNYAMRIWLNPGKMAALGVTVTEIKNALKSNNISFPAGSFQGPQRSYGIVSHTQLDTAQKFDQIILRHDANGTIRLSDVAKINFGSSSLYEAPMRLNGQNGLEVMIKPLQEANPITVAQAVKQKLMSLESTLPEGMTAKVNYNTTQFLKSSIDETFISIAESVILVILVVYLFLGSIRAASIPIVTIPVSIISVFGVIKLLGFSINIMSLLAMVLAIGLVVDDAIVMLENIHRHIERGMTPFQAAVKGSKEIAYAVMVMTLTLIAVYAPIGFVTGYTSQLFKEFAFTLGGAVLISGFVALTLSPMMSAKLLKPHANESRYNLFLEKTFALLARQYKRFLMVMLKYRHYVVLALVLFAAMGYLIFKSTPAEMIPKEDIGFVQVSVSSPAGASLDYTNKNVLKIEKRLKEDHQVAGVISQVYSSGANIIVTLKPWGQRHLTTEQVVQRLNNQFKNIPQVNAVALEPDIVEYGMKGNDIELALMTTGTVHQLASASDKVISMMKQYPGMFDVKTNLKFDNQQYAITINRDLCAVLGVSVQDVADTISTMMSGGHWTDIQSNSTSYPVLVQMQKIELQNFDALKKVYVRASTSSAQPGKAGAPVVNKMIPISSLVTLTPIVGQGTLTHYNRFNSATITARLAPGYTESQAIDFIKAHIKQNLSSTVFYSFAGKAQQFIDSSNSMVGIVVLAMAFIYLVLSAQFGSFIDPFVVLLAVPLSIVGALISLRLGGGTISIYSEVGFMTLIGMISKHGILITQFINARRKAGVSLQEAIIQGATIRLRPILMTTAAMVFGALPLAIATGPGSIGRHQIGWVIVGGLLVGTFFSLVVVPIAYSYLGKFKKFSSPEILE